MKKIFKIIPSLFMTLVILSSCGNNAILDNVTLYNGETLEIHTEAQQRYLASPYADADIIGAGSLEQSYPNEINLNQENDKAREVKISKNSNMSNAKSFKGSSVTNLEIGTKYYYQIQYRNGISKIGNFYSEDQAPRNLKFEVLNNTRDLGGWTGLNNKKVKQGLIYRSPEFNETNTKDLCISKADVNSLLDLGIKTDVDLRRNDVDSSGNIENGGLDYSIISKDINYVSLPMIYKGSNILTNASNKNSIKAFFELLSDRNAYPLVFHCAQGKDRTGCMAYVLNALLGVARLDLERDYMFTNFSIVGGLCNLTNDVLLKYGATLLNYEKDNTNLTLQQRTYDYLNKEIGVAKDKLDSVISILLDE